jgi:hypothetical protein
VHRRNLYRLYRFLEKNGVKKAVVTFLPGGRKINGCLALPVTLTGMIN